MFSTSIKKNILTRYSSEGLSYTSVPMQTYKYNHIEEILGLSKKKNSYFILKHSVPGVQLEYKLPRKNRIIEESSGKERRFQAH